MVNHYKIYFVIDGDKKEQDNYMDMMLLEEAISMCRKLNKLHDNIFHFPVKVI